MIKSGCNESEVGLLLELGDDMFDYCYHKVALAHAGTNQLRDQNKCSLPPRDSKATNPHYWSHPHLL